ncbi:hypothetical protein PR048_025100 [Dryococelus australis]|uniref:Transposase n=1 Tax=Dryococelus australis TaxID=614101 RepID=A0ABQ9GQE4_9NEOP|nr:hypothetical protein PR048_025100 [Dryococelus australis]
MERCRSARAEETGVPRENPPTSGMARHDSHERKSRSHPTPYVTVAEIIFCPLGQHEHICCLAMRKSQTINKTCDGGGRRRRLVGSDKLANGKIDIGWKGGVGEEEFPVGNEWVMMVDGKEVGGQRFKRRPTPEPTWLLSGSDTSAPRRRQLSEGQVETRWRAMVTHTSSTKLHYRHQWCALENSKTTTACGVHVTAAKVNNWKQDGRRKLNGGQNKMVGENKMAIGNTMADKGEHKIAESKMASVMSSKRVVVPQPPALVPNLHFLSTTQFHLSRAPYTNFLLPNKMNLVGLCERRLPHLAHQKPSICSDEFKAIKTLKSNPSIIILAADKGRATVILDKADYENKISQISSPLTNTYTWIKIPLAALNARHGSMNWGKKEKWCGRGGEQDSRQHGSTMRVITISVVQPIDSRVLWKANRFCLRLLTDAVSLSISNLSKRTEYLQRDTGVRLSELFATFDAEKHESDKDDTVTPIKCVIAVKGCSLTDKPRSGWPRATTPRQDRTIAMIAKGNRRASVPVILRSFQDISGHRVSQRTIGRRLCERGLNTGVGMEHWGKVLFSDESRFQLYSSRKIRVRRTRTKQYLPDCLTIAVQGGGCAVMAWGCTSAAGTGILRFIEGTMDTTEYIATLQENMLSSAEKLHDGYFSTGYRVMSQVPRNLCMARRTRSCCSAMASSQPRPQSNRESVEHRWTATCSLPAEKCCRAALHQQISVIWNEITKEECYKLVSNMTNRVRECIQRNGGATSY